MPGITVVIPAYNEENRIRETIQAVNAINGLNRIIVMNDGSSDNTSYQARQDGATVIDLNPNRGKGGAMNAALPFIEDGVIVFLDADLGSAAAEAHKIITPVLRDQCDLAIAAFPAPTRKGGFGLVKGKAARALERAGMPHSIAPLSGQRAMTYQTLQLLTPFRQAYGVELGMTLRALSLGLRVMEVPTNMSHQESGRDLKGFIHRGKQYIDVVRVLADIRRYGV